MLVLETGLKRVECVAFHPAGGLVAAGGRGVELWDVRTMTPVWQSFWDRDYVGQLTFTPDGEYVLTRTIGHVEVWNAETGTSAPYVSMAPDEFMAVSPADGRVVTGSPGSLTSWFPIRPKDWSLAPRHPGIRGAAFLPTGDSLLTHELHRFHQPRFVLRDPASGAEVRSVRCSFHRLDGLTFSPNGSFLVARLGDELLVWDVRFLHRPPQRVRSDTAKALTDLAFHPSGRYLAAASNDRTVKLFDTASWAVARTFGWDAGRMRSVAFAPDGLTAAAGGERGQLVVWDAGE